VKAHLLRAALVAFVAVAFSALGGLPGLVGSITAVVTALVSLGAMARFSRKAEKPVQTALAIVVTMFLVRLILVAAGTAFVARTGQNVVPFLLAFFIPYFAFVAIEGAFVHSLAHPCGRPA
jgi:hypothetical protein